MKEGGLSYEVEVLTVNGQGDEINWATDTHPINDGVTLLLQYESLDSLLFCSESLVFTDAETCLFVCLLFERDFHQVQVDLSAGEAWPQPLQCEAISCRSESSNK